MLTSFVGFNVDRIRFCSPSSRFGGSDTWFVTSSQNIDYTINSHSQHALAVWDWETCLNAEHYQRVTGKARYFRMSDDEDIRDPVRVATSALSAGELKNIGIPTQLRTLSEHEQSLLVTSTSAGLVFVHNITRAQQATELTHAQHTAAHTSAVNDIDVQHDKLVVASAGEDGQVHVISLADLKTRSTLSPPERRSITAVKHCTADTLALAMGAVTVLWDSRTDKPVMRCESSHSAQLTHHHVTCLAVHADQPHRLVTGASDGRVTLYDLRVNAALQSHTTHSSLVWEVKFLPQQPDALLSCGEDGQLLLWHANAPAAPVHRLLTNIMGVNSFDIHPEFQYLAASLDQEAVVFNSQPAEKL